MKRIISAIVSAAMLFAFAPSAYAKSAVHVMSPWVQRDGRDGCWQGQPFSSPHLLLKSYDGMNYGWETTTVTNPAGKIISQETTVVADLTDSSQHFKSVLPTGWSLVTAKRAAIHFAPNVTPYKCGVTTKKKSKHRR